MTDTASHAELMDVTYRYQRLFYDLTRRYYLFGRDRLIAELDPPKGGRVLEVGCGTGRNLAHIARRYPDRALCGIDISTEMLRSAARTLGGRAALAQADACRLDEAEPFGRAGFDRVVLSYTLSMIPDWKRALRQAAGQLRLGGELHLVDFGTLENLPRWFRRLLTAWLARFHVTPRAGLEAELGAVGTEAGLAVRHVHLMRGYAQYAVLRKVR